MTPELLAAKRELREMTGECIEALKVQGITPTAPQLIDLVYRMFPELIVRLGGELVQTLVGSNPGSMVDPELQAEFEAGVSDCVDEIADRGEVFQEREVLALVMERHRDLLGRMLHSAIARLIQEHVNDELSQIAMEANVSPSILDSLGGQANDWQYPGLKE